MPVRQTFKRISLCSLCLFCMGTGHANDGDSVEELMQRGAIVTDDELKSSLMTENIDLIEETFNRIRLMKNQEEILPLVQDLWNMRSDQHPDLPWSTLQTDVVRLEIAILIVQAHLNGLIRVDMQPFREFIIGLVDNGSYFVNIEAILALSRIDHPADVAILHKIASEPDRRFRVAVVALSRMCAPEADIALTELEAELTDADKKSYVVTERQKGLAFKGKYGTCDLKNRP